MESGWRGSSRFFIRLIGRHSLGFGGIMSASLVELAGGLDGSNSVTYSLSVGVVELLRGSSLEGKV